MAEQPKSLLHAVAERFKARGLRVPKEISDALKHYDVAPPKAQQRILNAFAVAVPKAGLPEPKWMQVSDWSRENDPEFSERAKNFCPAYPQLSRKVQAKLVLGAKPEQILRGLTPSEARKALCEGYDGMSTRKTAAEWLLRGVELPNRGAVESVPVARWVAASMANAPRRAALFTEHIERGPGGGEIHGRFIDRIDEIRAADLPNGPKTSVREAFSRAAARMYKEWEKDNENKEERLIAPPKWWKPVRYTKLLNTPGKLVKEGREMQHCVGTYTHAVRRGDSVIVSFNILGQRATVELSRDGKRVKQCYGAGNKPAPAICQRALRVLRTKHWCVATPDEK